MAMPIAPSSTANPQRTRSTRIRTQSRTRAKPLRDAYATATSGMAAPSPNSASTTPPRSTPPSVATSVSAEPSSGPEHGLQTRPSTAPSAVALTSERPSSRVDAAWAALAIGSIQREKRLPSAGTSITSANAISMAAPAVRTVSASMPSAGPSAPSSMPIAANDAIMPTPIATGAKRLP